MKNKNEASQFDSGVAALRPRSAILPSDLTGPRPQLVRNGGTRGNSCTKADPPSPPWPREGGQAASLQKAEAAAGPLGQTVGAPRGSCQMCEAHSDHQLRATPSSH
ncbi:hypothetical protein AAFF_G00273680 [Aldrovandia affinis]|uniref:Uncharacterized protein n=1 Tax=Aldrovandia affinis TaxID=143900 RepID=A0AAD7STH6_9TELE|nr:hypothetical protein AAFF_G00273680 [Aldrovandia affinis]